MFETMKKHLKIILTIEKSRMIYFSLIILHLINRVHNMDAVYPIRKGDFEYVVSIQVSNAHLCTGTIIHEAYVITIGHVLIGRCKPELSVVAGVIGKVHPPDHKFSVKDVYLHLELKRSYISGKTNEDYWENNVAIIKLAERFTFYGPVRVSSTEIPSLPCLECVMISWMYPPEEHEELLSKTWDFVRENNIEDCHARNISVLKNQKCFSNVVGKTSITSNDLGSPIVCLNFMIGFVVKETSNKIEGTPSTFLKMSAYSDFILEIINEGLVDVPTKEVQYIVSIWYNSSFVCSGSILDATHVLTTANCLTGFEVAQLVVVVGCIQIPEPLDEELGLSVHDIIFHERYTEHDIAVIVLEEPVPFWLTWHTLDYENTIDFYPGQACSSLHWKHWKDSNGLRTIRRKRSRMTILINEVCESILDSQGIPLNTSQFCARNVYNIKVGDARDRGNAIISEGRPVGILVKAFPLDDHSPAATIFLSLHPYIEFIRSAISRS